jgi:hypothetical protein
MYLVVVIPFMRAVTSYDASSDWSSLEDDVRGRNVTFAPRRRRWT